MFTVKGGETINGTGWKNAKKNKYNVLFRLRMPDSREFRSLQDGCCWIIFRYSFPVSVCICVYVTCTTRIQPIGLVERIQAIAQNMSDMAVRVEQILQRSMANSRGMT